MAVRNALWSGTLTFGLVSIPVALVPVVHSRRSSFRMVHATDLSPLSRRMYCPKDETFVHPEHIVRGYEIELDRHIVVRDSEIEAIEPKRSRSIEIDAFVPVGDIDPLYFRRPYYLVPDGPEKPYRLLTEVLAETKRAGVAKFVMHDREYFLAVFSIDDALCLQTLYYSQEVRDVGDIGGKGKARNDQVDTILKAMGGMTGDFDPARLRDTYQEQVDKLIRRKKKQKTFEIAVAQEEAEEPSEEAEEVDLIAALEESLARTRGKSS